MGFVLFHCSKMSRHQYKFYYFNKELVNVIAVVDNFTTDVK